jgi:hypothetical protein
VLVEEMTTKVPLLAAVANPDTTTVPPSIKGVIPDNLFRVAAVPA